MEELIQQIKNCNKCSLRQTCKSPIPGDGNFNSKILFIGEAPGADEDAQGKPFVGRSGKLLTSILEELGFYRDKHYYITNIVKCRPPNNRDPKPEEIQACSGYLLKQLELGKFKIVVTLGRFSMNFFIPQLQISKDHGKVFKITSFMGQNFPDGLYLLPCYHPAVALYNPSKKEEIRKDLAKLKILADKLLK